MVLKAKLEAFLVDSCDIYPSELPQLFGSFLTFKYLTWSVFAIGGIRFRPLSKIFNKRVTPTVQMKMQEHRWGRDFQRYAKLPSLPLLSRRPLPESMQPTKIFEKAGKWYRHYSELYSSRLAQNEYWVSFAKLLRQDPRLFSLGLTEGLLLYKFTAPITIPLTLFGVVKYTQSRREDRDGEEDRAVVDDEGIEEEGASDMDMLLEFHELLEDEEDNAEAGVEETRDWVEHVEHVEHVEQEKNSGREEEEESKGIENKKDEKHLEETKMEKADNIMDLIIVDVEVVEEAEDDEGVQESVEISSAKAHV